MFRGRQLVQYLAPVLPVDVVETARTLAESGHLERLITRGAISPELRHCLRAIPVIRRFARRPAAPVASEHLTRWWRADAIEMFWRQTGLVSTAAVDASFAWLDRASVRLLSRDTGIILAREDGCRAVFECARERGIKTVYQLPTAFYRTVRALTQKELALMPELGKSGCDPHEFARDRCERKDRELALADWVLCPCAFVRGSLIAAGFPAERIQTIPFGVDAEHWQANSGSRENLFLFVGNVSIRKGAHRLLKLWQRLGAHRTHTLRLIGDMQLPVPVAKEYRGTYEHHPRVAREDLAGHYQNASAFVFNAMADGFGLVVGEAMACGTPVLCSRNSGAPELVTNGLEGRLFEFGDDDQFGAVLDWALSHPDQLREMGKAARARAEARGWDEYGRKLVRWISGLPR